MTPLPLDPRPREAEVFRRLLRAGPGSKEVFEAGSLRAGPRPHWPEVLDLARRHGVLALLHAPLERVLDETGFAAEAAEVRSFYKANARRNLVLSAEVLRIARLLETGRIPFVCLKGPVLAEAVYGDLTLRQFSDLDFLVLRRDFDAAGEVLRDAGYSRFQVLSDREETIRLRREDECTFRSRGRVVAVDLHWGLGVGIHRRALPPEEVLERRILLRLGGQDLPLLGPQDHLLYLCLHGDRHAWGILQGLCDLAALVRSRGQWDWPGVLRDARRAHLRRKLILGLLLAKETVALDLPPEVEEARTREKRLSRLVARRWDLLFSRSSAIRVPGTIARERYRLAVLDTAMDRARYLLERAFLPTVEDVQWFRCPGSGDYLHHAVRPFRLAWRLARRARNDRRIRSQRNEREERSTAQEGRSEPRQ